MGDFVFTPSIQQRELIEPSQSKVRKRSNVWNPFLCGWQPRKQHLDPLFSTSLNVCSIIILNVFVGKFHVQKRLFALRRVFCWVSCLYNIPFYWEKYTNFHHFQRKLSKIGLCEYTETLARASLAGILLSTNRSWEFLEATTTELRQTSKLTSTASE